MNQQWIISLAVFIVSLNWGCNGKPAHGSNMDSLENDLQMSLLKKRMMDAVGSTLIKKDTGEKRMLDTIGTGLLKRNQNSKDFVETLDNSDIMDKRMLDTVGSSLLKKRMLDTVGSSLLKKRMIDNIGSTLLKKRMLDAVGSSLLKKRLVDSIGSSLIKKRMLDTVGSSLIKRDGQEDATENLAQDLMMIEELESENGERALERQLDEISGGLLGANSLHRLEAHRRQKQDYPRQLDTYTGLVGRDTDQVLFDN